MAAAKKSRLPAEYQEVEWIGVSGSQIIDTGIVPGTNSFRVQIGFYKETQTTKSMAAVGGNIFGDTYQRFSVSLRTGTNIIGIYSSSWDEYVVPNLYDHKIDVDVIFSETQPYASGIISADNNQIAINKRSANYNDLGQGRIYLFSSSNSTQTAFAGRIYYFRYLQPDGTVIASFVPCYRLSDGIIGMYDLVSDNFFTEIHGGKFTKGPDVT